MNESPDKKSIILDSQILSSWMSCKRLTDFRFNHNLVPIAGKGKALEMGSLAHHILMIYFKSLRDKHSKAEGIEQAFISANKYIVGDINNEVIYPGVKLEQEDIDTVLKTMREYFIHYQNEYWIPIEVEKVKGVVVYEDDEIQVLWKTKFDLLTDTNQGIYPVDHKTMSRRSDALSLNNQFMGQCVNAGTNAVIINKIGWQKTLKPVEKFTRQVISYSNDRLSEWKQLVGFYAKEIVDFNEMQFFPPNFTHCDKFFGCAFKMVCEADRNMRQEELKLHFKVGEAWEPVDE